jgi:hypothetical protein
LEALSAARGANLPKCCKSRGSQIQGLKGEAVLGTFEPLTTQMMRHYTAFLKGLRPEGKKQDVFILSEDSTFGEFLKNFNFS